MPSDLHVFLDRLAKLLADLESLHKQYQADLKSLQEENYKLRRKISDIQHIAQSPPTAGDPVTHTQKGPPMADTGEMAGFPRFSEFYKLPIEYHTNFEKAIRNFDKTQRESLKQAIRRLAKRGYLSTRPQLDHKKFEGGAKDLPVPAGSTASKSGRTVRFFWRLNDREALHIYHVGKRGDTYRSER